MTDGADDERGTRMRADARRNRDQIVAAARESFAERGIEVPMEEIARRAGVGVGTLYRRFPDREALIEAVVADTMQRVIARVEGERGRDPGEALWNFLHQCVEHRLGWPHSALQPRITEALQHNRELRASRQTLVDLVDEMVRHARQSGAVRDDVGTGDVLLILGLVLRPLPAVSTEVSDIARRRVLEIAIEGLRSPSPRPLPGRVLAMEDLIPGHQKYRVD